MIESGALLDPFERLLTDPCHDDMYDQIEAAGFFNILVPEAQGGAGLSLADAEPLIRALGRRAAPAEIATSIVGRALGDSEILPRLAAVIASVQIAGAGETLLSMTIAYANQRVQFGKPIARQQAVQHQLAIMSENVVLARIAGQLGCAAGLWPDVRQAGVAKQITSAVVPVITSAAHALHGAIGMTGDFALHRYVRHMQNLRVAHGSETYWARLLGEVRLERSQADSLSFILDR